MKFKNNLKFILSLALTLIIISSAIFVSVYAELTDGITAEGVCGKDVTWTLADDGTLTVIGSGEMYNYASGSAPWAAYKATITKVVIKEGVTHVGACSFYECAAMTEVQLPNGLVSIGNYAFYGCKGVSTVTIPDTVNFIGMYAFRKTGLKTANMAADGWTAAGSTLNGLDDPAVAALMLYKTDYGLYAYVWTRELPDAEPTEIASGKCGKTVYWTLYDNGLIVITGNGAMHDYSSKGAPWTAYRSNISKVIIEEGVTTVGKCSFYSCVRITSVSLPSTITALNNYSFYECSGIGSITIPAGVEYIGQFSFRRASALRSIAFENTEGWLIGDSPVTSEFISSADLIPEITRLSYKSNWTRTCVDHDYKENVLVKPTTFGEGKAVYTCSKCSDSYEATLPATKSLKLLAIGNSFSEDAFKHLYLVCKDAGIEEIVLGNLYIGGCSVDKHYTQMSNDTAGYIFYISDDASNGMIQYNGGEKTTAKFGIEYTDWDYITLQQVSQDSGRPEALGNLQNVIDYVNAHKKSDAPLLWHMTWAYQSNSAHSGFANYGKDQLTMYNAIVDNVKNHILPNYAISGAIPSGTAIQNLRTSELGDTLTRDGYHLSHGIGRYTAALTYLAYITGCDVDSITATPTAEVADALPMIKDAVKKAITAPFEITVSAYPPSDEPETPAEPETPETPEVSESTFNTTVSPLSQADRDYLASKGYDPDGYMLLDLEILINEYYQSNHSTLYAVTQKPIESHNFYHKFFATQIFTRNELVVGSLIRVESGFQYRPEGWNDYPNKNTLARPDNVSTELVEITDDWWGGYQQRAFNISNTTNGVKLYEEDAKNFKIYVPIVKRAPLTAEDKAYLSGIGLNPDEYVVLDYEYLLKTYYNSKTNTAYQLLTTPAGTANRYVATEIFSRYDLTLGSVIRVKTGYQYRADQWTTLNSKTADRPGNVSAEYTVVTADWWGDYGYRTMNISKLDNSNATDEFVNNVKVYAKVKAIYSGLTEEDKTYLTDLGLNSDEYAVHEYDYTVNAYYDSSKRSTLTKGDNLSKRFTATEMFTKDMLPNGTVLRITQSGYQYRPDAWTALDKTTSGRPGNVSTESVVVNDAWWGKFNYRGFNISRTDGANITADETIGVLRIYVKVA